jgi:hypothetical protein
MGVPTGPIAQGKVKTIVNSRERRTPPARSGGAFKVAAALSAAALLITASAALGAADPLKGGSTTLGPLKLPAKVKVSAKGGATKSGKTVTLPITGGTLDPTNGSGPVQDGGTIQLKKGKNKVKLTKIVTTFGSGGSITATLSGKAKKSAKSTKLATISGGTVGRAGFGGTVTDAVAKLTKKGAKALNNALGITHGGFKGGKLGTISTTTVPSTVTVKSATSSTTEDITGLPACVGPATCTTFAGKLAEDGITTTPSNGTTLVGPVLTFPPQTGGTIAPDCTAGTLTGSQGVLTLSRGPASITQANPNDDFTSKGVSFDVTVSGLGSLGRASATNLIATSCAADATSHTITVTATQTLQGTAALLVNQVFGLNGSNCPSGTGPPQNCPLAGGDPVGTTSYTINTQ